jgi:hypothetical protein
MALVVYVPCFRDRPCLVVLRYALLRHLIHGQKRSKTIEFETDTSFQSAEAVEAGDGARSDSTLL